MNETAKATLRHRVKTVLLFLCNPRLLLCLGIAWIITNGWSYLLLGLGTLLEIPWMIAVASGYLAFLWLPISPEKLATVAIAIALLRWLFPKDEKTLAVLHHMREKVRAALKRKKKEKEKKDRKKG